MFLPSENGKYSCTLDPSIKTPCCIIPRCGELPCFIPLWSQNNFKVLVFVYFPRALLQTRFLPPSRPANTGRAVVGSRSCPPEPPLERCSLVPWLWVSSGHPRSLSAGCRAPCAPALAVPWTCSCQARRTKRLRDTGGPQGSRTALCPAKAGH